MCRAVLCCMAIHMGMERISGYLHAGQIFKCAIWPRSGSSASIYNYVIGFHSSPLVCILFAYLLGFELDIFSLDQQVRIKPYPVFKSSPIICRFHCRSFMSNLWTYLKLSKIERPKKSEVVSVPSICVRFLFECLSSFSRDLDPLRLCLQ